MSVENQQAHKAHLGDLESVRPPSLTDAWPFIRDSLVAWNTDRASSMGAALAYYTLFSIAPMLLIVIAVAGSVFGTQAAQGAIYSQLASMLGSEGALAVQSLVSSVKSHQQSGWGALLGVVLLIVGATTVVAELQTSLDLIWRVPATVSDSSWAQWARNRFLSLSLVLGMGFLLMVSLLFSAAVAAFGDWWAPWFSHLQVLLQGANFLVGLVLTILMFAMIYKLMPKAKVGWRDVWVGATLTAVLFSVGKTLIGLYIGTSGLASGFGAASSLVVVLVWVYYSAQIFLIGAEMTWVYARRWGSLANSSASSRLQPEQHGT